MASRTVVDEEQFPCQPNAADSEVLTMAKGELLWLEGSITLRSVGLDAPTPGDGSALKEMALVCRRMSVVEALSMAARMAHTVHVSFRRYSR
jgi:hypothetical protein